MSTENLYNEEAISKLKEIVDQIDVGMLATYTEDNDYVHAVPMSRQEVDEQGNIWFLFSSESETYRHLQQTAKLSVFYSDVRNYTFLSINGSGEISQDKARIEKYWNKMIEGWFDRGKDDPRIRVLKVTPVEAHYWDTKSNRLVTFLKIAARAVTGRNIETGEEGELKL